MKIYNLNNLKIDNNNKKVFYENDNSASKNGCKFNCKPLNSYCPGGPYTKKLPDSKEKDR